MRRSTLASLPLAALLAMGAVACEANDAVDPVEEETPEEEPMEEETPED